jgi:hypothetical protein
MRRRKEKGVTSKTFGGWWWPAGGWLGECCMPRTLLVRWPEAGYNRNSRLFRCHVRLDLTLLPLPFEILASFRVRGILTLLETTTHLRPGSFFY